MSIALRWTRAVGVVAAAVLQAGPLHAATLMGDAATDLVVEPAVEGLGGPTDVAVLADGRIVVTQRTGTVVTKMTDGSEVETPISVQSANNEQGLLGVVAHPSFASNQYLYFYASAGAATSDRHHVIRYTLQANGTLTNATPIVTMGLRGPANHNGGGLQFHGGHLYISVGDTGANATPPTNKFGTCLNVPNGKILRVNDDGTPVDDNPLVGEAMVSGCDTTTGTLGLRAPDTRIFAWGLRNPFRFWVDPQTSKLWVGDVGETTREEISIGGAGTHFGWPFREGTTEYTNAVAWAPQYCQSIVPARACTPPAYDYATGGGAAVIGGRIVDSAKFPVAWRNRYVFGDNQMNRVWTLEVNATRDGFTADARQDFGVVGGLSSIRMGADGALYLVEYTTGVVSKVAPLQVPVAIGEPCAQEDLCDALGFCVDGVCCEDACDGVCEACDLVGQEGTCAAIPADQDPAEECPADPVADCDRDGLCDGTRSCRPSAKEGAKCGATTCQAGQVNGAICDGSGDCVPEGMASCGTYGCSGDACATSCEDDSSCDAASGYCIPGGTCGTKKVLGEACAEARECDSDYCVDGVCCENECAEQCAACGEVDSLGACVPVAGAPRGDREACAGDPAVCGGECDGNEPNNCAYRSNRVCGTSCADGQEITSNCDGAGECVEGGKSSCGNYACGAEACLTSCSSDADCRGGFGCTDADCVPKTGQCVDSDTSQNSLGDVEECAPYVCSTSSGLCAIECRSSVDCVSGFVCNTATDKCEKASGGADDAGCGCRVAGGSSANSFAGIGWLALLALGALRRRAKRRPAPYASNIAGSG